MYVYPEVNYNWLLQPVGSGQWAGDWVVGREQLTGHWTVDRKLGSGKWAGDMAMDRGQGTMDRGEGERTPKRDDAMTRNSYGSISV